MRNEGREIAHLMIAGIVVAVVVGGLLRFGHRDLAELQVAFSSAASIVALLALVLLVLRAVVPGPVEFERVALLAVTVSAAVAVSRGGWGAFLPLAAAVLVVAAARLRRDDS